MTDLAVLTGELEERVSEAEKRLDDVGKRITTLEERPALTADDALWVEAGAMAAASQKAALANRKTFWSTEKRAIVGLMFTAPISAGIGFGVSQVFQHLHVHF